MFIKKYDFSIVKNKNAAQNITAKKKGEVKRWNKIGGIFRYVYTWIL